MANQTFITNSSAKTLKKRLFQLIEHSEELKFLVGFFYFSGWQELYRALQENDEIVMKVLVGLDVDKTLGKAIEISLSGAGDSNSEKADSFFESLSKGLNTDEMDIEELYSQVDFFIEMIEKERLLIRKTAEPNHAKLYIFKIKDELQGIADCKFITGSSNLTRAGISRQNEFNVEVGDYGTEEVNAYFDKLWENALSITEHSERRQYLIDFLRNRSQTALVSPFEAYALILKTYIDLMEQKRVKPQVIRVLENSGYVVYQYQVDAVNQALTVIEQYNGVIIADVVGLGKSVIAGMIARHLGKRGMIICPPGLKGDRNAASGWEKYKRDFELHNWEIRSSGDLEQTAGYLKEYGDDIEVIIVDEAHRFRNQDTQNYEFLNTICRNRIVILLTATPFNNSPNDIFSLLKLFIIPGKSKITLDEDLESRFSVYESTFRHLSFIVKNYNSKDPKKRKKAESYYESLIGALPVDLARVHRRSRYLAGEIRKVLEPVLIRRNRIDLRNDPLYKKEVSQLSEIENPRELFYELSEEQSAFYDEVVNDFFGEDGRFTGAIYQPFIYEKRREVESDKLDAEGNRAFQQQRNLYDFMRRLLVKRFESSFGAFKRSIENFERIHKCVLQFIENSGGHYILDRKLIEKIYENDIDEIETALEVFEEQLKGKKTPKNNRIYLVPMFDMADEFLNDIQSDIDLMSYIRGRIEELNLVDEDPKVKSLINKVKNIINEKPVDGEPQRKVVIFSEYRDTVKHLTPILEEIFKNNILTVDGAISAACAKQLLLNFDAGIKKNLQDDTFQLLLTSDKLSEGVNLNRAGAIINYDIPWNPTRVIQRVGRINRISKKVFEKLRIYNFFPTAQGADIIKSRQIAAQKMFLIHNTLGEDSKIFDIDEIPSASELYKRINLNPEEDENESLLTRVRKEYLRIKKDFPDVICRINGFPGRIKTAKSSNKDELIVFRRKGLGVFVHSTEDMKEGKPDVKIKSFEEALDSVKCAKDEKKLKLSDHFWKNYELIKSYKESFKQPKSDISLEVKAMNNLQSALRFYKQELDDYLPFIRTLIKDLRNYRTLSKYTLRRIAGVDLKPDDDKSLKVFKKEIDYVRGFLGEEYLSDIEKRLGLMQSEVIIAVENVNSNFEEI